MASTTKTGDRGDDRGGGDSDRANNPSERIDPQAVLQMGVQAIVPKPFNLPELISLIEHLSP